MLGEPGTEQFTIRVEHDGKIIQHQKLHDPFIFSTTTIAISRWDLFKAMFRRQYVTKILVNIRGTDAVVRKIMMLDTDELERIEEEIFEERAASSNYLARTAMELKPPKINAG